MNRIEPEVGTSAMPSSPDTFKDCLVIVNFSVRGAFHTLNGVLGKQ